MRKEQTHSRKNSYTVILLLCVHWICALGNKSFKFILFIYIKQKPTINHMNFT